jgi:hypothetical protein
MRQRSLTWRQTGLWAGLYFAFTDHYCEVPEGGELFADHRGWGHWRWVYLWMVIPLRWLSGLGRAGEMGRAFVQELWSDMRSRGAA